LTYKPSKVLIINSEKCHSGGSGATEESGGEAINPTQPDASLRSSMTGNVKEDKS
jgi:hypothetical protein